MQWRLIWSFFCWNNQTTKVFNPKLPLLQQPKQLVHSFFYWSNQDCRSTTKVVDPQTLGWLMYLLQTFLETFLTVYNLQKSVFCHIYPLCGYKWKSYFIFWSLLNLDTLYTLGNFAFVLCLNQKCIWRIIPHKVLCKPSSRVRIFIKQSELIINRNPNLITFQASSNLITLHASIYTKYIVRIIIFFSFFHVNNQTYRF